MSNVPTGATFIKGDVKDAMLLERVFTEHRIHYVYHLGAYAAEGLSHFIRSFNYRTNLVGSVEILNQALKHNVECFLFTSSIAVYGSINDLSQMQNANRSLATSGHKPKTSDESKGFTEEDQPTPEDPYGIAKFAFELDLRAAKELFGMDFIIFRPHNVYGPHQNIFDKYRNVVGIFINQIAHNAPMTVFGTGEQVRAFSYIDDVAPVISRGPLVAEARNQIFNVGGDKPYTVNQLATAIREALGVPAYPVDHQPARLEVEVAVSNHDKVKEVFGTPEAIGLEEGLEKTVAWYRSRGKFFQPVEFESVEVKDRMPPSWVHPGLRESSVCKGSRVDAEAVMDGVDAGLSSPASPEKYLEDDDLAFWIAARNEVSLTIRAVRNIRSFYVHAPILLDVDAGGAMAKLEKACGGYGCTVRESESWLGAPRPEGSNFSCAGYMRRFSAIQAFAPSASYFLIFEPGNRLLSKVRDPFGGSDVYQLGSMDGLFPPDIFKDLGAVEGFPQAYPASGGTLVRRSSLPTMLAQVPALDALFGEHRGRLSSHHGQGSCLFVLAALGKLRLAAPQASLRPAESCGSPGGSLHPCYRCIHTCKLHEDCYRRDDWLAPAPISLRPFLRRAYYAVAEPLCWVASEPCSCASRKAAQRADACIRACSYTCPSLAPGTAATQRGEETFIDCGAITPEDGRAEL